MYRSLLLRVWRQRNGRVRASLEDVDTGGVTTFDRLDELCEWLEHHVDDVPRDDDRTESERAEPRPR